MFFFQSVPFSATSHRQQVTHNLCISPLTFTRNMNLPVDLKHLFFTLYPSKHKHNLQSALNLYPLDTRCKLSVHRTVVQFTLRIQEVNYFLIIFKVIKPEHHPTGALLIHAFFSLKTIRTLI